MSINSLEEPQHDPNVDGDDVQVRGEEAVDERAKDRTSAEDKHFSGVSVFSRQAEWCGVLVMDLVDVLVQYTGVECLMCCMNDSQNRRSRKEKRVTYQQSGKSPRRRKRRKSEAP